MSSAWPGIDHWVIVLRLCVYPELFLCPYYVYLYSDESAWWPVSERQLSSDQQQSAICFVIHRGEWDWMYKGAT
jgi:hypothetical protein